MSVTDNRSSAPVGAVGREAGAAERQAAAGERQARAAAPPQRSVPAWMRWLLAAMWAAALTLHIVLRGVPADRVAVLAFSASAAVIASLGRRKIRTVLIDFLPFAGVLIVWDYLRGLSDSLGMPTWWLPQLTIDRTLFLGHDPTVWLQEHLRRATAQWYDSVFALCYLSFFLLPVGLAAVLWVRSRASFYRWAYRYAAMSGAGFLMFALAPTAPPWAAGRCTGAEVAAHPYHPHCMDVATRTPAVLLGPLSGQHPGVSPWVVRGLGQGLEVLHLHWAHALVDEGQARVDLVAAVPSLHAGVTLLITLFFWRRVRPWVRSLLVVYPLLMAVTLVYAAEHYVTDVLVGWLVAVAVTFTAARLEPRIARRFAT